MEGTLLEFLGHSFFLRRDRQECELHKQTGDTDGNHRKQDKSQVSIVYACELAPFTEQNQ